MKDIWIKDMAIDLLSQNEISEFIKCENTNVFVFDCLDSTNLYAKSIVSQTDINVPALIVANSQTNGRGRLGNSFYSPANTGIYMTIITRKNKWDNYTLCAANAVCETLSGICKKQAMIKWVNDIFIDNKKVCGILTEATQTHIICGIGINLITGDFPDSIKNIAGAVFDDDSCLKISRNFVIADIFNRYLSNLCIDNSHIVSYYKSKSLVLNKNINFVINNEIKSGYVVDIEQNGNLKVLTADNGIIFVSSGEVSIGSESFIENNMQ